MSDFIKRFSEISLRDLPLVGGKNASLGEMFSQLSAKGVVVPDGFATTAAAFWTFLNDNGLREMLQQLMASLDTDKFTNLKETGEKARALILNAQLPKKVIDALLSAYRSMNESEQFSFAVRSSATAEDLPQASFAGQHESYLNIRGEEQLLQAVKKCFASLYTNRAIKYREDNGFAHEKVALSVGVQKMVRSDRSCSGVAFTLEPESGFSDVIHISGVWGLGENLVQGTVTPDEFLVFKPTLRQRKNAIIQKRLGDKTLTMVYAPEGSVTTVMNIDTPMDLRDRFVLSDVEITTLANWCLLIEEHYGKPMDIEWAKDGITKKMYIIQARPETVQSARNKAVVAEYKLLQKGRPIASGQAIGTKIAFGKARILSSPKEAAALKEGEIVVTTLTSPDWDPVLKNAAAIVTDKGGRTSHASIVARELGVPAVVGCKDATQTIKDGEWITVSCCEGKEGKIYRGELPFIVNEIDFSAIQKPSFTKVMLILSDPDKAFQFSFFPNDGVGLLRMEFIITHFVQVHPMALVKFNEVKEEEDRIAIKRLTHHFADKKTYFIDKLAQGIASIAAPFYPKDVIVRMSDFKTNEYANLIGGTAFEPQEENPMLGFRGASRYYHPLYKDGFALECAAIKKVREEMGFTNVKMMIPFCRTLDEAKKVIQVLAENGLDRRKDPTLQIYMMAEIPSNVLLAEKFAALFDGFSIGSNDLTQLTLGIDRDSTLVSNLFSESDEAAKMMIGTMIEKAVKANVTIGLCGQAPSDDPAFAQFLVQEGINSISFNPDALLKGIENINVAEGQHQKVMLSTQPLNEAYEII
ncbi:MAG: phosphoenolpyruvate synthase [Chitinophagaceae bacterium]|nr:MAG: phosphoenolpyruvate synthase [Chitinophagaceae bacterium]